MLKTSIRNVLIPYLQGSLFRLTTEDDGEDFVGLNPLSTGKSVQTKDANDGMFIDTS